MKARHALMSCALLLTACPPPQPTPRPPAPPGQEKDDLDLDGIPDRVEAELLEKYRPYYKFSKDWGDEEERPTDAVWFIRHSALLTDADEDSTPLVTQPALAADPSALLTSTPGRGQSYLLGNTTTVNDCPTGYFLNVGNDYRHGYHDGDGSDWPTILSSRVVGLYGHVSRHSSGSGGFQIEYWQFYGYNETHKVNDLFDHEGDWEGVIVVVNAARELSQVIHAAHGRSMTFTLAKASQVTEYLTVDGALMKELRGPRYSLDDGLNLHDDDYHQGMDDNVLRLHCPLDRRDCPHPVVYIEQGSHGGWPTEHWKYEVALQRAPSHNGRGKYQYLTAAPPNLGEVGRPMPGTPGAEVILKYNGHWGAFSRGLPPFADASTPAGPAMHDEWGRGLDGPAPECLE